jgi:hypothetical protein
VNERRSLTVNNRWSQAWWSLTLVAAVAGGILFPLYLHALDARGSWDFFPGVGVVAGAATGWTFWYIASTRVTRGAK